MPNMRPPHALSGGRLAALGATRGFHHGLPGYRVYFGRDGDALIILLGGGTKKRQQRDIETARSLWREYNQRKRRET